MGRAVDDAQLTNAWEMGTLGRPTSHEEHLRIARTLIQKHGRQRATARLVAGTRLNCDRSGVPERFDEQLTRRWANVIAEALSHGAGDSFDDFARLHPELRQGDLLGPPVWKRES